MGNRYKIFFSFILTCFAAGISFAGNEQQKYFEDKDGFFFFIGIDFPNRSVNLVWDEVSAKPVQKYIVERSADGNNFIPVITQSAVNKPRDVRDMSGLEQETIDYMDKVLYTTEAAGHGRFIFNELIPSKLFTANLVLGEVLKNKAKWNDKDMLDGLYTALPNEQPLIYR